MKLIKGIQSFFGTSETIKPAANSRAASVLSVDIVNYALSLASTPEAIKHLRSRLTIVATKSQDEVSLAKLYLDVERYLLEDEPVRTFDRDGLRQQVWARYSLAHAQSGLALLFVRPPVQEVRLAALVAAGIFRKFNSVLGQHQLQEIVREAATGSTVAGITFTATGVDLGQLENQLEELETDSPVFNDFKNIFKSLLGHLKNIQGAEAVLMFEQAYLDVETLYGEFLDDVAKVATLLPEGVVDEEKLRFVSRDELEQKVKEKTAQLETEKATVQERVRERTQQLGEEQAKLASSIESLSQGLVMIDNDDHIILQNTAATKVLGYGRRRWSLDNVAHDLGEAVEFFATIKQVRKTAKSLTLPEVKLGARFLRLSLTPVLAETKAIGVVILMEDITEVKVLERSRDEFFSIASHELRTPLTAIRGNTSMIQKYFAAQLKDPDLKSMVTDIHDSSVRLIEIVNDFLDASRLEQGRMKFTLEDFNVCEIIEKVTYELAAISREKHIYLHLAHDIKSKSLPLVYADIDRTKQVVYNLLGNAMKFVDKGGVTISGAVVGDHLKISVTDTGPGISQEGQQLLFHKFQQTGNSLITRDTTRGTGLGLYISKQLIEHMDGSVTLDRSEVGKGSTFSFTLPLSGKDAPTKK